MSGIIKMVHRADHPDGPFKTIAEVADELQFSKDTIRRWAKKVGVPTHKMPLNEENNTSFVWLYTLSDIKALSDYGDTINHQGGRPKKDS